MKKLFLSLIGILVSFFVLNSIVIAGGEICNGEPFALSQWTGPSGCYISYDRCLGDGIAHAAATNCDRLCNDTCSNSGNETWASHTSSCYEPAKYCVGDQYTANCSCYQVNTQSLKPQGDHR